MMNKKSLTVLIFINLLIAISFFVKNLGVGYSQLSSDLHNIIPMCMKLDNMSLFTNDLFLNNVENFKYYTPFFIEPLRFLGSLTNGDYILALNILLFVTHLIFGITWFAFFYRLFKNYFWIAFLLSILIRGIVWLPGYEIWGISDLWTLMPRTVYSALLPIPFFILLGKNKYRFLLSSLLIGFIFNFHPITGLGGILIFFTIIMALIVLQLKEYKLSILIFSFSLIIVGMLPFILTYFNKTDTVADYDLALYTEAFLKRIPASFQHPMLFIKQWIAFKYLFFLTPTLIYFFIGYKYKGVVLERAKIILLLILSLFFIPMLSYYVEGWINSLFGLNIRMSFQIIRMQKLVILPMYIAMGFLLLFISERKQSFKLALPYITTAYIVMIIISRLKVFDGVPFISDDITRNIFPQVNEIVKPFDERKDDFDKMALFISNETLKTGVFYSSYMLRSASKRAVKFDHKGASILIEGNPIELINWYLSIKYIKELDEEKKVNFLKEQGIHYILTRRREYSTLPLIKKIGEQKLYKIL